MLSTSERGVILIMLYGQKMNGKPKSPKNTLPVKISIQDSVSLHSYDTYIWLHPLSSLRVKNQNFKILVFDIFKKHIRLKKNSATTKLFLFFSDIISTETS